MKTDKVYSLRIYFVKKSVLKELSKPKRLGKDGIIEFFIKLRIANSISVWSG